MGAKVSGWLEWVLWIVAGVALAVVLRVFVIGCYVIPSGSMLDTIAVGEQVMGEKLSYLVGTPRVGDIVTFDDPDGSGDTLIKRVVATAGQTVDLVDGAVIVDGTPLEEAYTLGRPSLPLVGHAANLAEDVSYPFVVPEGCVWVMGDNRTNSADSRYFGAVSTSNVTSHAVLVYWPPQSIRGL